MPVLDISVVPVGTQNASFSSMITDACRIVEEQGLKYQITPTGTVIEGEMNQLLTVVKEMHQIPFKNGAQRVITNIMIDERHDKEMNMEEQVQAVGMNIHK